MILRNAKFEDWKFLLECRNDEETRNFSFNSTLLSEEEHKDWLIKVLSDQKKQIFILQNENIMLGTTRIDEVEKETYVISFSIHPGQRGGGYGTKIIETLLLKIKGTFIAEVKKENLKSIKIFETNGFFVQQHSSSDSKDRLIFKRINK